jgi:hypothetical protein
MVSVCPQKHVDSEALTSRLLALRWQISQLRKETGHSVPLVLNGQVGSAMTDDMLWQAAIPGEGWTVWRESNAPCSIAAWVTTGGAPAMQQQVLMNSLMSWFHQHVRLYSSMRILMFRSLHLQRCCGEWDRFLPEAGVICLDGVVIASYCHAAGGRLAAGGTDSTVISPFPDFILPLLPEGSGLTPRARTWRCALVFSPGGHRCAAQQWLEQSPAAASRELRYCPLRQSPMDDYGPKASAVAALREMRRCWMTGRVTAYRRRLGLGFIRGTSADAPAGSDPLVCAAAS